MTFCVIIDKRTIFSFKITRTLHLTLTLLKMSCEWSDVPDDDVEECVPDVNFSCDETTINLATLGTTDGCVSVSNDGCVSVSTDGYEMELLRKELAKLKLRNEKLRDKYDKCKEVRDELKEKRKQLQRECKQKDRQVRRLQDELEDNIRKQLTFGDNRISVSKMTRGPVRQAFLSTWPVITAKSERKKFYIGATSHPEERMRAHSLRGFKYMHVLYQTSHMNQAIDFEELLLGKALPMRGCLNKRDGSHGLVARKNAYYVYLLVM